MRVPGATLRFRRTAPIVGTPDLESLPVHRCVVTARSSRLTCGTLALLLISLLASSSAAAQPERVRERLRVVDSTRVQILTTADGSELVGRIIDIGDSTLTFQMSANQLTLRLANILGIEERPASAGRDGRPWFPHGNLTSLVLGPTGRTLPRGGGQFALYEILFPTVSYGFTDRLTLGAGVTIVPGLGLDEQVVHLLPKVGVVRSESVNIAVGALILRANDLFDDDEGASDPFGILYGVGTFGGPDANLTTGIGYGFFGDDLASQPLLQVGGQLRFAERGALITENWFFRSDNDNTILSWTGLRFLAPKVSFDAAAAFSPAEDFWFPWVSVTIGF
jgi:hypothetical protein